MKPAPLSLRVVEDVLRAAVREDVGSGDLTTAATVPPESRATGRYHDKTTPCCGRIVRCRAPS